MLELLSSHFDVSRPEVSLDKRFAKYETALRDQGLGFMPFPFNPLLNGNDDYRWKDIRSRKQVKIYYDDGQGLVTRALHGAIGGALATQATVYRDAQPGKYCLAQVADYLCGIELMAAKYKHRVQTKTDTEFFGGTRDFKKNFLKKMRKKRIA